MLKCQIWYVIFQTATVLLFTACRGANGKVYKVGESFKVDCNTCSCRSDGQIVCTLIACPAKCKYNGKVYTKGDRFPAKDGCNECTCGNDGSVSCTEKACGYGK